MNLNIMKHIKLLYTIIYILNVLAIPVLYLCVDNKVGKCLCIVACICSLFTLPISYRQIKKNHEAVNNR